MLDAPGDPEDLWLARGPEVSPHRMLMQGDIVVLGGGPVAVVTHACSMRRGTVLHATQMTAPIQSQSVGLAQWATGFFDWMPLPGLAVAGVTHPAALLRTLHTVDTAEIEEADRVGVMSEHGVQLLQQRLAHHLTRVVIDLATLGEHCAPILAEAELHEEWLAALGPATDTEFQAFLDADDRKVRSWLGQPGTRPQAMRAVRRAIKSGGAK